MRKKTTKRAVGGSVFALRVKDGTCYWDGYSRRERTGSGNPYVWKPKFPTEPRYWATAKLATNQWKKYEFERRTGFVQLDGSPLPEIELVRFEQQLIEAETPTKPVFDLWETIVLYLRRNKGGDHVWAFNKMAKERDYDPEKIVEYRFAFKRKGKTKEIMETQIPEAVNYGTVSVVRNEADLMLAKLILGSNLVDPYDLGELYEKFS